MLGKSNYVGFAIWDLGKLHIFETYYGILQIYFRQETLQCLSMDCDSSVLSIRTQNTINDVKK